MFCILEAIPARENQAKAAKIGRRELNFARRWYSEGLLSEEGLETVVAQAADVKAEHPWWLKISSDRLLVPAFYHRPYAKAGLPPCPLLVGGACRGTGDGATSGRCVKGKHPRAVTTAWAKSGEESTQRQKVIREIEIAAAVSP